MIIQRSRPNRAAHCSRRTRKVRYRTHEDATRALTNIKRVAEGQRIVPVRAYRCEVCDGWHLTSQPTLRE
jgi:hypothetical protein